MITVRHYPIAGDVHEHLAPERVSELIADESALTWVDVEDPTDDELATIVQEFGLHRIAADDLRQERLRPRIEQFVGHVFIVARDVELIDRHAGEGSAGVDEFASALATCEIDVVLAQGWIVTVRKPDEAAPSTFDVMEVAHRFERQRREDGATDEGFFLAVLLDHIVERAFDALDKFEDRLDELEGAVFAEKVSPDTERRLFTHRRDLVQLRRSIAPLREVVGALVRRDVQHFSDTAVLYLRDVHDNLLRVLEIAESQRDLLTGAMEAHLAVVSNRMNQVMKKMTSWGAILVSASLVAGIYGMNFDNMPELHWAIGYPFALATMFVVTLALYFAFKRRDWL